jgi:hypothetical protein
MAGGVLQGHTKMHGPSMFALSPHSSSFPHKDDDTISNHNLISYLYIINFKSKNKIFDGVVIFLKIFLFKNAFK